MKLSNTRVNVSLGISSPYLVNLSPGNNFQSPTAPSDIRTLRGWLLPPHKKNLEHYPKVTPNNVTPTELLTVGHISLYSNPRVCTGEAI